MKPITDHELLKLAEKWDITRPNFIGHKTAFAQGFRQAEQLLIHSVVKSFVCPNGCGQNGDMGSCIKCVGK